MIHFKINSIVKVLQTLTALGVFQLLISCVSNHATIKETTAQRIVLNESSRATVLDVYLQNVEEGVTFNYLVYNRQKVDVAVEDIDEMSKKISALVQAGGPFVNGTDQETVNEPNQLVYTVEGKQYFLKLDDIVYLPTKLNP